MFLPSTTSLRNASVNASIDQNSANARFHRNDKITQNWQTSKYSGPLRRKRTRIDDSEIAKSLKNMVIKNMRPQGSVVKGNLVLKHQLKQKANADLATIVKRSTLGLEQRLKLHGKHIAMTSSQGHQGIRPCSRNKEMHLA